MASGLQNTLRGVLVFIRVLVIFGCILAFSSSAIGADKKSRGEELYDLVIYGDYQPSKWLDAIRDIKQAPLEVQREFLDKAMGELLTPARGGRDSAALAIAHLPVSKELLPFFKLAQQRSREALAKPADDNIQYDVAIALGVLGSKLKDNSDATRLRELAFGADWAPKKGVDIRYQIRVAQAAGLLGEVESATKFFESVIKNKSAHFTDVNQSLNGLALISPKVAEKTLKEIILSSAWPDSTESYSRRHAAALLARMGTDANDIFLAVLQDKDPDDKVIEIAALRLVDSGGPDARAAVIKLSRDETKKFYAREAAIRGLRRSGDKSLLPVYRDALLSFNSGEAADALAQTGGKEAALALREYLEKARRESLLKHKSGYFSSASPTAFAAYAKVAPHEATEYFRELMRDPEVSSDLQNSMLYALEGISETHGPARDLIVSTIRDPKVSERVRETAIVSAYEGRVSKHIPALLALLGDATLPERVRARVASLLAKEASSDARVRARILQGLTSSREAPAIRDAIAREAARSKDKELLEGVLVYLKDKSVNRRSLHLLKELAETNPEWILPQLPDLLTGPADPELNTAVTALLEEARLKPKKGNEKIDLGEDRLRKLYEAKRKVAATKDPCKVGCGVIRDISKWATNENFGDGMKSGPVGLGRSFGMKAMGALLVAKATSYCAEARVLLPVILEDWFKADPIDESKLKVKVGEKPNEITKESIDRLGKYLKRTEKAFQGGRLVNELTWSKAYTMLLLQELSKKLPTKDLREGVETIQKDSGKFLATMENSQTDEKGNSYAHTHALASFVTASEEPQTEWLEKFVDFKAKYKGGADTIPYWLDPETAARTPREASARSVVFQGALYKKEPKGKAQHRTDVLTAVKSFNYYSPSLRAHVARDDAHQGEQGMAPYYYYPTLYFATSALNEVEGEAGAPPAERELAGNLKKDVLLDMLTMQMDDGLFIPHGPSYPGSPGYVNSLVGLSLIQECKKELEPIALDPRKPPDHAGMFGI